MKRIQLFQVVAAGAYVVFACNMAISYFHALELFSAIGHFPGWFAHIAVVAFDTVFALSNIVVSIGIMKKVKIGWQVWFCFVFGLYMTTWSNVRASMGDQWILLVTGRFDEISTIGWESLLAGVSTPTALVAIELLLFWMVVNRKLFAGEQPDENNDQPSASNQTFNAFNQPVITSDSLIQPSMHYPRESNLDSVNQPTNDVNQAVEKSKEAVEPDINVNSERVVEQPIENKPVDASGVVDTSNNSTGTPSDQPAIEQPKSTTATKSTNHDNNRTGIQPENKPDEDNDQPTVTSKPTTNVNQPVEADEGEVVEIALKLYEEQNKMPSRRQLAKLANCTEYRAAQIIKKLKADKIA